MPSLIRDLLASTFLSGSPVNGPVALKNADPKAISLDTISRLDDEETKRCLYIAAISLMATEAQLIWNRYNTMFGANSFIAVFIGAIVTKGSWGLSDAVIILLGSIGGLYLSIQWKGLTVHGWEIAQSWVEYANKVHWDKLENPINAYAEWCKKSGRRQGKFDWIATHAQRVINFFILIYVLFIIASTIIILFNILNKLFLIK
jgi:hypothetical protein